jgi:hypothetical protein
VAGEVGGGGVAVGWGGVGVGEGVLDQEGVAGDAVEGEGGGFAVEFGVARVTTFSGVGAWGLGYGRRGLECGPLRCYLTQPIRDGAAKRVGHPRCEWVGHPRPTEDVRLGKRRRVLEL